MRLCINDLRPRANVFNLPSAIRKAEDSRSHPAPADCRVRLAKNSLDENPRISDNLLQAKENTTIKNPGKTRRKTREPEPVEPQNVGKQRVVHQKKSRRLACIVRLPLRLMMRPKSAFFMLRFGLPRLLWFIQS